MKPDTGSINVLSTVRARAKMHEFRVPPESYNALPRDPKMLFSLAVGILGDAAAALARHFVEPGFEGRPETWTEEDGSISDMVRFSAVFFDAYLEAQLDADIAAEFSLLCACSYYLSEAVGNATVVARRSEAPPLNLGGGLALLAFRVLRGEYTDFPGEAAHSDLAQALSQALRRYFALEGDEVEIVTMCTALREQVYASGTPRELLYGDLVVSLCARKLRNAARNLIPPHSGLPLEAWAPALLKFSFPTELWPAQQRICEAGLLKGRSALIQMPTSAGKTRATELIIRAAFLSKRTSLAVIVAPFRSLCHDIRSDVVKAFSGEDVLIDEISDSYLFDVELQELFARNSVIVVTPEKLLYMLRRAPELAERIGLIVYDEGHQFEGFARGPTYELLLSSLRMTLKDDAQVVLISAVIGNAPQIAEWLIRDAEAIVGGQGMLPTAKSIAFASWKTERGQLQYVQPTDPEESEFYVPRVIAAMPLEKLTPKETAARLFPERNSKNGTTQSTEVALYLGLHLVPNGSVAVFCGQKGSVSKTCRRVGEIFARKVPVDAPTGFSNAEELDKISRLFARQMGADADVAAGAGYGVLAHHANVPHGLRLTVEHAMKEGHARFVVCTSTLAQGVNFPIKYLIVTATQQGKEKIKVRDFHNLMGRAGRAGMHTESSVIFS
ncbi:DEAD/DEAH box helicase, partial [Microvirga brassicacearum]